MAKFGAYWNTGEYGKLWFEAESMEAAQDLIAKVDSGDLPMRDLPGFILKIQGAEGEISNLELLED